MDRLEAKKFMKKWLWESPDRKTSGIGWPEVICLDVVQMLVDATETEKNEYRELFELWQFYEECMSVRTWLTIKHKSPWHPSHEDIDNIINNVSSDVYGLKKKLLVHQAT